MGRSHAVAVEEALVKDTKHSGLDPLGRYLPLVHSGVLMTIYSKDNDGAVRQKHSHCFFILSFLCLFWSK